MKQVTKILFGILFAFGLVGCSKNVDKPNDENEHESINRIELVFLSRVGLQKALC